MQTCADGYAGGMDELHGNGREHRPTAASRPDVVTQLPSWMWLLATVIAVGLAVWFATQEGWAGLIVSVAVALMCGYAWRARTGGTTPS
jgi:hypothetical protein